VAARLRLRHLWFLVPFWALAIRSNLAIRDNSFLWHVQAGVDQLHVGEVLRTDPYSLTASGQPWRTQSWLIELGYGRLESWFPGLVWVPIFVYVTAALTLALVLVAVWSRSGPTIGAAIVLLTIGWVAQPFVHARPVLLSFAFFAVIGLITALRRPPLWVVPGLLWLWAAIHGSFVIGAVFLGLDAIRRRSRREAAAVGIGLVAASLTAHGLGVWETVYRFAVNREGLVFIQEWQPPDFTTPSLAGFLVALTLLMVGLAARRLGPGSLWIVAPAVVFGMSSTRSVLPGLLIVAPWLGEAAQVVREPREPAVSAGVVWVTAGALAVAGVFVLARPVRFSPEVFPSPAARDAIDAAPLFNTVGPGGALIYLEQGSRPVFIDDRVELYGVDLFTRYSRAAQGIEWRGVFAEFDVQQALLPTGSALVPRLDDAGWGSCYADDYFTVVASHCPRG
jgi:hypothetical protein